MPVTAKLSKQFYDRLGEAVTNELVDWFNQVDASYKFDIREMNELNFARFDAKLEQRLAETRADVDRQFTEFRGEMRVSLAALDAKIDLTAARITTALEKGLRDQTRFFFGAWGVLLAAIVALSFRR
jgi:hypothetical protein